jgi:hypothetical protein
MSETYEIHIGALVSDRYAYFFGDLTLKRQDDGTSVLIGEIRDQSELHGVLAAIRDLRLPLVSVKVLDKEKFADD